MQRKKWKTDTHNQETDEDSDRNIVSVGKTKCKQLRKINGHNEWAAENGFTNSAVHTNTNASTVVEIYCERQTVNAEEDLENFLHGTLYSWVNLFQIFCT